MGSSVGPLFIGIGALLATLAGGAVALRFRGRLAPMLGFSSGALIGVALLDLLPEAAELGGPNRPLLALMSAAGVGLVGYLSLDRLISGWKHRSLGHRRHLGPGSLTVHSLLDGVAIGVAFEVSAAVGLVVAGAVLAHDMLDGANTVTLSVAGGATPSAAGRWLVTDAAAPLVGILLARTIAVAPSGLATLLAFFAGGLLYIGASELLPRSREQTGTFVQVGSVGMGMGLIYLVVRLSIA